MNGKGRGRGPEPAYNWAGRGVKGDVATSEDPATGVAGDTDGVGTQGRGNWREGVESGVSSG